MQVRLVGRLTAIALGLAVGLFALRPAAGPSADTPGDKKPVTFSAEQVKLFEREVLPILQANCLKCHGDGKIRGGLQLTSRDSVLKGGDTGPAVSLDKPDSSLLVQAINYKDVLEMPPSGKLPQKDIDALTRWVKAGLPWSSGGVPITSGEGKKSIVTEEARRYWAYQPIKRLDTPKVKQPGWVKNPIDAFVLAKLEGKGLSPNPAAERVALVRRAYYDLIGLPPTPEQVDAFVNDHSADAYEKLIDRLLESSQYGEKWGRHWLDLVRYAETNGYERDGPKPFAWRFRDYVIRSFNEDKPYDRFIQEQLAGDELVHSGNGPYSPDPIIATGYYRLGLWDDEPADPLQARYDELDDYVATTAQVFLGMTMNCARCHDHKIDPIPQKDYYQLVAFFQDVQRYSNSRDVRSSFNLTDISPPEVRAKYEAEDKRREAQREEITAAMTKIEDEAIKKLPAEDQRASEGPDRPLVVKKLAATFTPEQAAAYKKLQADLEGLRKRQRGKPGEAEPDRQFALSVNLCQVKPTATHLLVRGNPHAPASLVEPAFPQVLGFDPPTMPPAAKDAKSSGRRTVLAKWIASPQNPLTARVMANRLWQYHFGRGIVASANDFGKFGTLPTHPELLDWLASELMAGGWKLKRMHKLIMLSNVYQMSARSNETALRLDPENTLLWRYTMRRLTAEELRDSILAVSGTLNPAIGGPSVYPPIPREVLHGQSMPGSGWGKSTPEEASRRSVYVHIKRSLLVPILSQHDQADTDSSCPVRYTTTVPTQALGMLNGDFTNEQATALAERVQREAPDDLRRQVQRVVRLTTGRIAAANDLDEDLEFIRALGDKHGMSAAMAMRQYCLLALNQNEFVYLD